jgi:inhibitor of KinA sporulation pathway (predicted exonuclease)
VQYIVMDLEWNQARCPEKVVQKPVRLAGEIIQIGAIRLDEQLCTVEEWSQLVKPLHYTKMHSRVKRMTGIDEKQLAGGLPFPQAMECFRQWMGQEQTVLLTWGEDDRAMLLDNFRLHGLAEDWVPPVYNLQWIFNMQVSGEQRQWSLQAAMEKLDIQSDLQAHDALNDARNTAEICRALDMGRGMADYAGWIAARLERQREKARQRKPWPEELKGFVSRSAAMGNVRRRVVLCPQCGEPTSQSSWVPQDQDRWMFLAKCADHGEYLVRARLRWEPDGTCRVERSLQPPTEEERAQYMEKRARRRAQRRRRPKRTGLPQEAEGAQ